MPYQPFLTGSHAYGYPKPDSDIDLVVYLPEKLRALLEIHQDLDSSSDDLEEVEALYESKMKSRSLRFGNLNLICCLTEEAYNIWKQGTAELKKKKPVPRDFAIRYFAELSERVKK